MRRTPLNMYSEKKIAQLQAEAPIRIALCKRAGGKPITREVHIYRNGQKYTYTKVECIGGTCECQLPACPKRLPYPYKLEPHEIQHRSLGGVVNMDNTIMVLRLCHIKLQHNEPIWSNHTRNNC